MQAGQVEIVKAPTSEQLASWYQEHDIKTDETGAFTDIPYGPAPVDDGKLVEQVRVNALRHDIKNMPFSAYNPKIMVFVAGGPSLEKNINELREKADDPEHYEIFTSNATCKYLLSKGIIPKYHVIVDPTERKKHDLEYDCDEVNLLIGLQCHPAVFDARGNRKTFKFLAASALHHTPSDVEVAQAACTPEDPNLLGIGGGSMMGTRALYLAAALGYRRLEYYGFDACVEYNGDKVRCYSYDKNRAENILEVEAANGRKFFSTIAFARQATEIVSLMSKLPGLDVVVYGDSFMSNQVAMYKEATKPAPYRISPEYLAIQREMHKNPVYGVSSAKHAPRVFMAAAQILRKFGKCDVLDYGCGKQKLREAIEASFPAIKGMRLIGYDPSISGLDKEPAKADLTICSDVMEHIEPQCVDTVIKHIFDLTEHVAIFNIYLQEAKKMLPDGRNAHICIRDKDWWLSFLKKYFVIIEQESTPKELLAVVQPIPRYQRRESK